MMSRGYGKSYFYDKYLKLYEEGRKGMYHDDFFNIIMDGHFIRPYQNKINIMIERVIFNPPATIVWFGDGDKVFVKTYNEEFERILKGATRQYATGGYSDALVKLEQRHEKLRDKFDEILKDQLNIEDKLHELGDNRVLREFEIGKKYQFKKKVFIQNNGVESYNDNKGWVDELDGVEFIPNDRFVADVNHYNVLPEYCIEVK